MAEKPKKKSAKPAKKDEPGVLGALPSQRPARIGAHRTGEAAATPPSTRAQPGSAAPANKAADASKPKAATTPKRKAAATPKPKATATPKAKAPTTPKPKAAAPKPALAATPPGTTASRPKAAAPRTFEPTQAAETAAADSTAPGSEPRPRAVSEGARGMGTTPLREEPARAQGRPSGTELLTTAIQAAGELAQIGLTVGGQLLKRAVDRLPRP